MSPTIQQQRRILWGLAVAFALGALALIIWTSTARFEVHVVSGDRLQGDSSPTDVVKEEPVGLPDLEALLSVAGTDLRAQVKPAPPPAPVVRVEPPAPAPPQAKAKVLFVAVSGARSTVLLEYLGKTMTLGIGDELDGAKVVRITRELIEFVKDGKQIVTEIPNGE